jgi:hypothetical protein
VAHHSAGRRCRQLEEGSISFLKKRNKKALFRLGAAPKIIHNPLKDKSFLVLFFKKELFVFARLITFDARLQDV